MYLVKLFFLTALQLLKQAWLLPGSMMDVIKHRQQRAVLIEREVERLDRIRNPSKYLGKE